MMPLGRKYLLKKKKKRKERNGDPVSFLVFLYMYGPNFIAYPILKFVRGARGILQKLYYEFSSLKRLTPTQRHVSASGSVSRQPKIR